MKTYITALETLLSDTDPGNIPENLRNYAASRLLVNELKEIMNREEKDDRHTDHSYIIQKLGYFMDWFQCAVMPEENSEKTSVQLLEEARLNLYKIRVRIGQ
jgi:hypothetical protein